MPKKLTAAIAITGISATIALGLGGCGGSAADGAASGTLRVTYASFPSYLDPALAYDTESYTALYNTYIPLLTYAHADGAAGGKVVPGLAKALPKISDGGKTYTLFLRPGLRYSDGTSVNASDFTNSVERMFRLDSGGSGFFTDIVGAEHFLATKQGGIPGIQTNDKSGEIVIHLTEPRGTFSNELGLLFTAPLPPGTPDKNQTATPPPATGPYAITSAQPGQSWSYERNPQWLSNNAKRLPDLPSGHVDRIDVTVVRNPSTQVNDVEQGKFDFMENPPPTDRYAEVKGKYEGSQFRVEPQINTYYFWMNTQKAPFDDLEVRQAVNYAIDPAALERIYAGSLARLQQVLPEGMPGHKRFELYPYNLAKAKQMIAQANPSDREITVWSDDEGPNEAAATYYQDVLEKLGFDAKLKVLSSDNYFTVMGNRSTPDLDTGWVNWFEDYPNPNDFFEPLLSAESIQSTNNTNWSQIDDPALSAKIAKLGTKPLGPKQEAEYADLDREFMEQAPWAPYGTLTVSTFVSSAIDLDKVIFNPTFGQDLTSFEFK
ncbi:MAG TPA: ABC transporter substrate-binding protein [Solirubrobacterales bacterium]|jgi:peptide/nickel transport system substrate-binding protein|nr:ABC transporter substrate-binding protein [Solirubrobacterales bacterium]